VDDNRPWGPSGVDGSVIDDGPVTDDDPFIDEGDTGLAPEEIETALDAIERELADVELALDRLGEGSYGRCETCGQTLSEDELEAAPAGRFCRSHLPLDLS
jgi:RNA polymerase-binding transcription factor DksA